jgi:hypothetical protein
MSTALEDIAYDLIEGIFTVLDGNLSCPVYKSIPKPSALVYAHIYDVTYGDDGTKDDFVYSGTVRIEVVDESHQRPDKKAAETILGIMRTLLKPAKSSVFSCGTHTLSVFSFESTNEIIEPADNGISRVRLIDMYNFIIE